MEMNFPGLGCLPFLNRSSSEVKQEPVKLVEVSRLQEVLEELKAEGRVKRHFFITSSGGGGHHAAKDALRDRWLGELKGAFLTKLGKSDFEEHFSYEGAFQDFCRREKLWEEWDVMHDYLGVVGRQCTAQWNGAQKAGNVEKQERLVANQSLANKLFAPVIFLRTLAILIRLAPEEVVSTQAMGNHAILSAIAVYNRFFKEETREDLHLDLWMTDMPTELSTHFFEPIEQMHAHQLQRLRLHVPPVQDDFRGKMCFSLPGVDYEILEEIDLPVRPAFLRAVNDFRYDRTHVQLKASSKERELLGLDSSVVSQEGEVFDYSLGEEDQADFLLLGSQVREQAIFDYIDAFSERAQKEGERKHHLFIYTGKFQSEENCFFKRVLEKCAGTLPDNLKVLPLSYQDPGQLVSLFSRCDTLTCSGGSTVMEGMLMKSVMDQQAKQWEREGVTWKRPVRRIHSQKLEERSLEESIPLWERGNYHVARDCFGAKICSPETLWDSLETEEEQVNQQRLRNSVRA